MAPHAAPSIGRSDEKAKVPWALTIPSGRTGESPMRAAAGRATATVVDVERHDARRPCHGDLLHGGDSRP